MSFSELLGSRLLQLPFSYKESSCRNAVKNLLKAFLDKVKELDDGPLNVVDLPSVTGRYVKNVQDRFIHGLLETIDLYYEGMPSESYRRLSHTLNNELKDFSKILKIRIYGSPSTFFRMRIKKGNVPLEILDMFHIPFELRGLISTQRYSIPGFPCLYLGRTLYGCWEELNRPEINEFQVARLKTTKAIKYLDLTSPEYKEDLLNKDIYHYFMTWPLIACCSIKVNDYSHSFKPEYIIPQLLLQWVRQNGEIDGIRFNSTHIDFHNTKSVGDFSNLVLPVKENKESGHCQTLKSFFEITQPISWQIHEHAIGGQIFLYNRSDFEGVDSRIQKLELIKGRAYPYSYSILGKLEQYLDGMKTYSLNNI